MAIVKRYDYIIVGAGSAGCVLAGELAKDPSVTVLALECGQPAESNPETLLANGYKTAFMNDNLMWERFSVPQSGCMNKRLYMGSGRGVGGSGSVNGMVYTRGSRADFDAWGVDGWRWKDVVDDFAAIEKRLGVQCREETEFTRQCIWAAESEGFARKDDFRDGNLCGYLGYEWMNYQGNQRRSSYVAFLRALAPSGNIEVQTEALVRRIVFEGRTAVGVEFECNGERQIVRANREVVLCAGALETPKLLDALGRRPRRRSAPTRDPRTPRRTGRRRELPRPPECDAVLSRSSADGLLVSAIVRIPPSERRLLGRF